MTAPSACFQSFDKKALELVEEWYFNQSEKNPFEWEAVEKPSDLPRRMAGVYAAIANSEIIYIGQSQNLRSRLQSHGRKQAFKEHGAKIHYLECDRRFLLEQCLLFRYTPRLNRTALKPAK